MKPYYADDMVRLYCGDMRDVLPALDIQADAIVTDPPYGETDLKWDRWAKGWPSLAAQHANSMWCFGSLRMFTGQWAEFGAAGWTLSHETIGDYKVDFSVWEKHTGSGLFDDRFVRVHELIAHFYTGLWRDVHHEAIRERSTAKNQGTRRSPGQVSHKGATNKAWHDDGTRLAKSILRAPSLRGKAIHPTEKPAAVLDPLIQYSVPVGGLVLDPFTGSASTLFAARMLGRRAVGIEAHEPYAEAAARRLSIPDLFGGAA